MKNISIILAAALLLFSCSDKKKEGDIPPNPNRISFSAPAIDAFFMSGDTMQIAGDMFDKDGIKFYTLAIYHAQYDTLIQQLTSEAVSGTAVNFEQFYSYQDTLELDAYISVEMTDENEVLTEGRREFHFHGKAHE